MISGSLMKRGSFKRRSTVITAGRSTSTFPDRHRLHASQWPCCRKLRPCWRRSPADRFPQHREHLARLICVVINGLLAHHHQAGCSFSTNFNIARAACQRLNCLIGDNVNSTVRAHRQTVAKMRLAIGRANRANHDFCGDAFREDARLLRVRYRRTDSARVSRLR